MAAIVTFSALILVALTMVSVVNKMQNRKRVIRLKVQQLKTRVHELEDINLSISSLLESTSIPKLINEEIVNLLQSVFRLDPESASLLTMNLENAENLISTYSQGANPSALNRVQPSDAAIAKQQYYLTEVGKLVRRHKGLGRIDDAEMQTHIKELAWAHLMVAVVSHVAQGHQAFKREDYLVATGHYKSAQALVRNSTITDEKRHRLLKELSELVDARRVAISADLMPETLFNPSPTQSKSSAAGGTEEMQSADS